VNEERHLEPTPARIAKARNEGNVPRSSELVAACAFGTTAIVACGVAGPAALLARESIVAAARGTIEYPRLAALCALALSPTLAGALVAAFAGIVQAGGVRFTSPAFKAERLDPMEGVRRILSRETVAHGVRAAGAFTVAVVALTPTVAQTLVAAASANGAGAIAAASWTAVERGLFVACAIGMLFAIGEYALARGAWLRKLRMSLEELKREIKEHEGDPHVRGRRRGLRRELLRGSLRAVREATFVVVNPQHVALALAYHPPDTPVPRVLVRAAESAALRVREMATRFGVPVIENAPLARALFRDAGIGLPIPAEHYVAVAEIVVALGRSGALGAQAS
jgi:flagellar biosynthetic protein FlhB